MAYQLEQGRHSQQINDDVGHELPVSVRTWPSYPCTPAFAKTCVSTGPSVVALYVVLQAEERPNSSQRNTKNGGPCSGAAWERNWAT